MTESYLLKEKRVKEIESEIRKYNMELTEYYRELHDRSDLDAIKNLANDRGYSEEFIKNLGVFLVRDSTEMLIPKYMDKLKYFGVIADNNRPIFTNRWVIPIFDEDGLVQNMVGYSKYEKERYVYGTARYYSRRDTLYGLENIREAFKLGYAIVTEGITDSWLYRSMGYISSFANCGTHGNVSGVDLLNNLRYGVIVVPDRDNPGNKAYKRWKYDRKIRVNTSIAFKDSDEMCRGSDRNKDILRMYIDECIEQLKLGSKGLGTKFEDEITVF